MNDKEVALEVIAALPEQATLGQIRDRIDFLAAIKDGREDLDKIGGISHSEVKRKLRIWITKARTKATAHQRALERASRVSKDPSTPPALPQTGTVPEPIL